MSWEAFRLTSKSPAELLSVMGPGGVDQLVREALMACWRSLPEAERTMEGWRGRIKQLWDRNMRVWTTIRRPTPEAFFADLAPFDSDGFFRQALVMTWMMLPRTGGRDFEDTFTVIRKVFDRVVEGWETDFRTFSGTGGRPRSAQGGAKRTKGPGKPDARKRPAQRGEAKVKRPAPKPKAPRKSRKR